jgi:hypothetical protein
MQANKRLNAVARFNCRSRGDETQILVRGSLRRLLHLALFLPFDFFPLHYPREEAHETGAIVSRHRFGLLLTGRAVKTHHTVHPPTATVQGAKP